MTKIKIWKIIPIGRRAILVLLGIKYEIPSKTSRRIVSQVMVRATTGMLTTGRTIKLSGSEAPKVGSCIQ